MNREGCFLDRHVRRCHCCNRRHRRCRTVVRLVSSVAIEQKEPRVARRSKAASQKRVGLCPDVALASPACVRSQQREVCDSVTVCETCVYACTMPNKAPRSGEARADGARPGRSKRVRKQHSLPDEDLELQPVTKTPCRSSRQAAGRRAMRHYDKIDQADVPLHPGEEQCKRDCRRVYAVGLLGCAVFAVRAYGNTVKPQNDGTLSSTLAPRQTGPPSPPDFQDQKARTAHVQLRRWHPPSGPPSSPWWHRPPPPFPCPPPPPPPNQPHVPPISPSPPPQPPPSPSPSPPSQPPPCPSFPPRPPLPPPPYQRWPGPLDTAKCAAMLQDPAHLFRRMWASRGWASMVGRLPSPACWSVGRDGQQEQRPEQYFDDVLSGRWCGTNWYAGTSGDIGTTGPAFADFDSYPALLGFDEAIDSMCRDGHGNHAEACVGSGMNILSLFSEEVPYNTCRNFEWQVTP